MELPSVVWTDDKRSDGLFWSSSATMKPLALTSTSRKRALTHTFFGLAKQYFTALNILSLKIFESHILGRMTSP